MSFSFSEQDDVAEGLGVFGGHPTLFEVIVLNDLGNGGEAEQMERTFVLGADQHENGMHLGGLLRKAKALFTAGEQDIEMLVAVDDDMRDGEKRAQYRRAFFFSFDEEAAEGVGIDIEMFGHSIGGLIVRRCYLEASISYTESPYTWSEHAKRIVLIGTPNRGSSILELHRWKRL